MSGFSAKNVPSFVQKPHPPDRDQDHDAHLADRRPLMDDDEGSGNRRPNYRPFWSRPPTTQHYHADLGRRFYPGAFRGGRMPQEMIR